jgi:3'5'-cyclic nucleotide phosphodiesterase
VTIQPSDPRGGLPQIIINNECLYEGNLIEYFKAFFLLGNGLNNPYHNFRHGTHVLFLCHDGGRFHNRDLTPRRFRNLLIAALFHDFNHRGVAGDDAMNIEFAIAGLRTYVLQMDKPYLDDIELLLRGTQFPYVLDDSELPLEGLILRDADMMQAFSAAWIQQVVFGLAEEWGKDPIYVLKMQKDFLSKLTFKTDWGRWLVPDAAIALKINEANSLYDLLVTVPAQSPIIQQAMEEAIG